MDAPDTRACRATWWWLAGVMVLAVAVKAGALQGVDRGISGWAQAIHSPARDRLARAVTFFGSSPCAGLLLVFLALWCWRRRRMDVLVAVGMAGVLALGLQVALRVWVAQWRPDAGELPAVLNLWQRINLAGFTSGHAFRSAFLYGWLSQVVRSRPRPTAAGGEVPPRGRQGEALATVSFWVLIGLVGLTRVYFHRHWPSDVVGGWLIAATALTLARCEAFVRLVVAGCGVRST